MTIQQLIKFLELPEWLEFWIWVNIIFVIIYSCNYMMYTDGQVTIKYIQNLDEFKQSIPLYTNSYDNISLLELPNSEDIFYQFKRIYNDELDKNHKIQMFNYIIWYLIIPFYNIIYGLYIIFSGIIFKPKDLYISIISIIRGVKK